MNELIPPQENEQTGNVMQPEQENPENVTKNLTFKEKCDWITHVKSNLGKSEYGINITIYNEKEYEDKNIIERITTEKFYVDQHGNLVEFWDDLNVKSEMRMHKSIISEPDEYVSWKGNDR